MGLLALRSRMKEIRNILYFPYSYWQKSYHMKVLFIQVVIVKGAGGTTGDWNGAKMTTGEENSCLTLGLVTDETNEEEINS